MSAFDSLAVDYDEDFTHSPISQYLRRIVHKRLLHNFQPKQHILEFGCGTGEDAIFLAQREISVTATDVSPNMLTEARKKAAQYPQVEFQLLDLNNLDSMAFKAQFDGAFANFGPLNCVSDISHFAEWLAKRIKLGGVAAFGVMSPLCLWEMAWHSLHGDFSTAFRRLNKNTAFAPENTEPISIYYPSAKCLTQDFQPYFRRVYLRPLGLFLPPSDVYGAIEKRPKLLKQLTSLDEQIGAISQFALFADHYWIEFERIDN